MYSITSNKAKNDGARSNPVSPAYTELSPDENYMSVVKFGRHTVSGLQGTLKALLAVRGCPGAGSRLAQALCSGEVAQWAYCQVLWIDSVTAGE